MFFHDFLTAAYFSHKLAFWSILLKPYLQNPVQCNTHHASFCHTSNSGSTCPFKGQVYHECIGCPPTCANYDQIVPCPLICLPGCACPTGTVLDEQSSTCVAPEQCPGMYSSSPVVSIYTTDSFTWWFKMNVFRNEQGERIYARLNN